MELSSAREQLPAVSVRVTFPAAASIIDWIIAWAGLTLVTETLMEDRIICKGVAVGGVLEFVNDEMHTSGYWVALHAAVIAGGPGGSVTLAAL